MSMSAKSNAGAREVSVLIIDDETDKSDQLKRYFLRRNAKSIEYQFVVDTRPSIAAGVHALRNGDYDVLVLDVIFPAENEKRGLDLALDVHRHLGLKVTVRILITAHPRYADCVEAARAGAWDYLPRKGEGGPQVFEELVVDSALSGLRKLDFEKEMHATIDEWLQDRAHYAKLTRDHVGQIVALWHKPVVAVIAAGKDEFEVAEQLRAWKHEPWQWPFYFRVAEGDTEMDPESK